MQRALQTRALNKYVYDAKLLKIDFNNHKCY